MVLDYRRGKIFVLIIFFFGIIIQSPLVYGQSQKSKLIISRPEFFWALSHPFKVSRALSISKTALQITDSIETDSSLKDRSGGQLDAFKHGLWMALLTQEIGRKAALKLGNAHEKANYLNYKRGRPYSSHKHSVMDSLNNLTGANFGNEFKNRKELISKIIDGIKSGNFYILKKNSKGQYVDCHGNIVIVDPFLWERNECLIRSDLQETGG